MTAALVVSAAVLIGLGLAAYVLRMDRQAVDRARARAFAGAAMRAQQRPPVGLVEVTTPEEALELQRAELARQETEALEAIWAAPAYHRKDHHR